MLHYITEQYVVRLRIGLKPSALQADAQTTTPPHHEFPVRIELTISWLQINSIASNA